MKPLTKKDIESHCIRKDKTDRHDVVDLKKVLSALALFERELENYALHQKGEICFSKVKKILRRCFQISEDGVSA